MRGFQDLFCFSRKRQAERIFQRLSPRILPEVFLIGLLEDTTREDRHSICVEPGEDFWFEPDDLAGVVDDAEAIARECKEGQLIQSLPAMQVKHREHIRINSRMKAVERRINAAKKKPDSMQYFVGHPGYIEGFLAFPVLGLSKTNLTAYPRLVSDEFPIHENRGVPMPRSLMDAVVEQFFLDCGDELSRSDPGQGITTSSDEHLLTVAAKRTDGGGRVTLRRLAA